jgi:hypothetical protein
VKKNVASAVFAAAVMAGASSALAQLRVVTLNGANSAVNPTVGSPRRAPMQAILQAIGTTVSQDPTLTTPINTGIAKPIDVLCLQEVESASTTCAAYADILNSIYGGSNYTWGPINGTSTGSGTQGIVYNKNSVSLVSTAAIGVADSAGQPRQALRYQLRPVGYTSSADVYAYNSHYKSANDTTSAARRNDEAQAIRLNADALGHSLGDVNPNIIYLGDFNVYKSSEAMYQTLLSASTPTGGTNSGWGQAFDPINKPGTWTNTASFTKIHTQSPYSAAARDALQSGFSGTTGGMDDRFDFQLATANLLDGKGVAYIPGSYQAFGNNGTHGLNNTIDSATNTAQPANILQDMAAVLDHLPVVADYQLPARLGVTVDAAPAKIIVGATATVSVAVSNTAPVSYANGADTLSYNLSTTGSLSGSASGTRGALTAANTHSVTLNSATVGNKSGTVNVSSTSQQVANNNFSQTVPYQVVGHSNASFSSLSDTDATSIDFGYVPVGSPSRSGAFAVHALPSSAAMAGLDLDSITSSGDTTALSTTATTFTNIAQGQHQDYFAALNTSQAGIFSATHTLAVSDQDLPGAITGTSLVLTTTARVFSQANFPVTGFMYLPAGEDLTTGPMSIGAGVTLTKTGTASVHVDGAQSHGANSTLAFTGGTLVMDTDAGSAGSLPLGIHLTNSGTTATFNASQHLRSLSIGSGTRAKMSASGNANGILHVQSLSLAASTTLDLTDNDLVVENGNFSTISSLVLQGYRDSADSLATGIVSSTSQTSIGAPILAVFDNTMLATGDWPFGSGESVGASAVLGKYTYLGDADLNGMVTPDDYGAVDSNLGNHVGTALESGGMNWFAGDWNLDGEITPDDYGAIDANLGLGQNNPLAAQGMAAQGVAAVPEPCGAALVAGAGLVLARRRRQGRA